MEVHSEGRRLLSQLRKQNHPCPYQPAGTICRLLPDLRERLPIFEQQAAGNRNRNRN